MDFMDNLNRVEREGRARHTGEEIMAALAGYLGREKSGQARPQTTFAERIAHRSPEQLELIPRTVQDKTIEIYAFLHRSKRAAPFRARLKWTNLDASGPHYTPARSFRVGICDP